MTFRVLGPLEVRRDGRPVRIAAAKQRVVLAQLLLRVDRLVTLTELYEGLWGERLPATPKAAVHNYIHRLRGYLDGSPIHTTPAGYQLQVDPEAIDLYRFRGLVERARRRGRGGDTPGEAATLRDALALWRGSPLADVPSDHLQRDEVPGLEEERLAALDRRITVDLELGAHAGLIGELRGLTSAHPLRERFWWQLIMALYRDGRPADALTEYHRARRTLAELTGIDPGTDLRALYHGILDEDVRLAGPLTAPAGRAASTAPSQLPGAIADFSGRQAVTATLAGMLAPEPAAVTSPLLVLTGPPGVGKTALAAHVGQRIRSSFPDGQLYADLRGFSMESPLWPDELLPRFLRALGVSPSGLPADPDEQAALYRSLLADRRILVVLDNVVHPDQVRPLLPAEPRCALLVTSRDTLTGLTAMQGARHVRVEVLEPLAAVQLLQAVIGEDRAMADLNATADLARLCGYFPLALRIAGAVLTGRPGLTVRAYVGELSTGDRLRALAVGGDTQATVWATFEQSYRALDTRTRLWFRYLGLLPGAGFSTATAAALLDAPHDEAAAMLAALSAASLVENPSPGRFRLHELIRFYAVQLGVTEDGTPERAAAEERVRRPRFLTATNSRELV